MSAPALSPFVAYRDLVLARNRRSDYLRTLVLVLHSTGQAPEWEPRRIFPNDSQELVAAEAIIEAVQEIHDGAGAAGDLEALASDVVALRRQWEEQERQYFERQSARTRRRLAERQAATEAARRDAERRAFEAEVTDLFDPPISLQKGDAGEYLDMMTRDLWLGWLLRAYPATDPARQALCLFSSRSGK